MTVATNTALAKIGAGVGSFAFSATTSLIVPGLTDTSQLISGPIAEIPAEHHRFRELCGSIESPYNFDTKLGRVKISTFNVEDPFDSFICGVIDAAPRVWFSFEVGGSNFCFIMEERHFETRLDYKAGLDQFAVSQMTGVPYDKDDTNYHESIAIVAGAEILRVVGEMEANKEHPVWTGILASITGDRVTPSTAYHLGSILNDQLFSECGIPQMIYATLDCTREDNFHEADFADLLDLDFIRGLDGFTSELVSNIQKTFVPGERTKEAFKQLQIQRHEVLITDNFVQIDNAPSNISQLHAVDDSLLHGVIVMYTPPNLGGHFFRFLRVRLDHKCGNAPKVIIVQNVQAGAPYAPIVGDLLRAAKIMRPDFPYQKSKRY